MDEHEMKESDDRLSKLPISLIFVILSFLPMRDVVFTTLLSKRWNNLWTTIPYLYFCENDNYGAERVRNFVNRALMFWKGIKILKFRIDIVSYIEFDTSLESDIDLWVRFAVENKVEELKLLTHGHCKGACKIPQCLKSCSSIRKISLTGCNIGIHGSFAWNQLSSLKIFGVRFFERSIDQILLGTPQLEVFELSVMESYENLNIRSISLKKLKIKKYMYFDDEPPSVDQVLGICCPNLESLEISGMFYKCLVADVPYLNEATLGFNDPNDGSVNELLGETLLGEILRGILPTIQHAEKLTLSVWCVEVLCTFQKKYLPSPLQNIKILKLFVDIIEPIGMMNLLGIFPNIKMLVVIEDHDIFKPIVESTTEIDEDNAETMSFSRSASKSHGKDEVDEFLNTLIQIPLDFETIHSKSFLKTIEITSKLSNSSIFRLIEILLKHATMLENLVIRAKEHGAREDAFLSKVGRILMSMPRSSPTAKLFFKTN